MIVNQELDTRKLVGEREYYRNLRDLFRHYMIGRKGSKGMETVNYRNMLSGKGDKVKEK